MRNACVARALLFLSTAALSALVSDWAIEGLATAGAYGGSFVEHDHRSVVCSLTGAALLIFCWLASTLAGRTPEVRTGVVRDDWLVRVARDVVAKRWSSRSLAKAFVAALVVRYVMESVREVQTTGQVASGADWLGGPLAFALAVHFVFCAAAFFGLLGVMRLLDRSVRGVVALVIAVFAALRGRAAAAPRFADRERGRLVHRLSLLARHLGERAPPTFSDRSFA